MYFVVYIYTYIVQVYSIWHAAGHTWQANIPTIFLSVPEAEGEPTQKRRAAIAGGGMHTAVPGRCVSFYFSTFTGSWARQYMKMVLGYIQLK